MVGGFTIATSNTFISNPRWNIDPSRLRIKQGEFTLLDIFFKSNDVGLLWEKLSKYPVSRIHGQGQAN